MFAAVIVWYVSCQPSPLTSAENAFVGKWRFIGSEDNDVTFDTDRTFRTNDGEFTGKWWISDGELKMKVWRVEPSVFSNQYANQLAIPFANTWASFTADIDSLDLVVNEDVAKLSWAHSEPEFLKRLD